MADPGFMKREGRESKCIAPGMKKSLSGGGGGGFRHISPPEFILRHLHYEVGVPSAYQTDLRSEKKGEKNRPKGRGGGGPAADSAPPPESATDWYI